jgi:hypothetical protein
MRAWAEVYNIFGSLSVCWYERYREYANQQLSSRHIYHTFVLVCAGLMADG